MGCICCGKEEAEVKLPAHMGNLRACYPCVIRHGAKELATEADRLLTEWFLGRPHQPVCLVCGVQVVIYSDGTRPLWCDACEKKRVAYVNDVARSG
jgi:hypothetical protein